MTDAAHRGADLSALSPKALAPMCLTIVKMSFTVFWPRPCFSSGAGNSPMPRVLMSVIHDSPSFFST